VAFFAANKDVYKVLEEKNARQLNVSGPTDWLSPLSAAAVSSCMQSEARVLLYIDRPGDNID